MPAIVVAEFLGGHKPVERFGQTVGMPDIEHHVQTVIRVRALMSNPHQPNDVVNAGVQ